MTFVMNCNMCVTFKKSFFNNSNISFTIRDYVYTHLLTCKKCYKEYKDYAKEIGLKFDLRSEAINFAAKFKTKKVCKTREQLISLGFEKDIEACAKKWTLVAARFNLSELLKLKAFNDFSQETMDFTLDTYEDDVYAANEWAKYFAKQLCTKLDFLEECFIKEVEDKRKIPKEERIKEEKSKNEKTE